MDGADHFGNWLTDAAGRDQLAHLPAHSFGLGVGTGWRLPRGADHFVFVDGRGRR